MEEEDQNERSELLEAVSNTVQQESRPRIKFVRAKYNYTQNFGDQFTFERINDKCEIVRGYKTGSFGGSRATLYDSHKLQAIKQWIGGQVRLSGIADREGRGFASSNLYALAACPVFRQHATAHKQTCHRIGCNLCKIYNFYEKSEDGHTAGFPLEIRSFDLKYKPGDKDDSAKFFSELMDVLQTEELSGARAFGETDPYTTAIGQMFRIETVNKVTCKNCGRQRSTADSFWTLIASQDLFKEVDKDNKELLKECKCDACGSEMYISQEITKVPIIFTVQLPHWDYKGQYRKKNIDIKKYLNITVNDVKLKLVAFTTYDGFSDKDGRFSTVFLSSSGVWNLASSGQVQTISSTKLDSFQPQLLFFSRDEENEIFETATITRADGFEEEEAQHEEEEEKVDPKEVEREMAAKRAEAAIEGIRSSIQAQRRDDFTRDEEERKEREPLVKEARPKIVKNPLSFLLKKSAHDAGTWGDAPTEKREISQGFVEEKPDEWDATLDKGHQRKVRSRREIPEINPFDNVQPKQRGDRGRDRRGGFGDRRGGFHDDRRGGFRGGRGGFHDDRRGGFHGGRGGSRGGRGGFRGGQRGGR